MDKKPTEDAICRFADDPGVELFEMFNKVCPREYRVMNFGRAKLGRVELLPYGGVRQVNCIFVTIDNG